MNRPTSLSFLTTAESGLSYDFCTSVSDDRSLPGCEKWLYVRSPPRQVHATLREVVTVSLTHPVASDHQLARLLQIGMVLEEVVEARAHRHYETLDEAELGDAIVELLGDAAAESEQHRRRLEELVDGLDADPVAYEEIEQLVTARYETDTDFDGVLYDQLCNEETAYKFYDDLVAAIENSDVTFGIDRDRLLSVLREIREQEKAGVEEVTELMEDHA
jgi:rubrerythrin